MLFKDNIHIYMNRSNINNQIILFILKNINILLLFLITSRYSIVIAGVVPRSTSVTLAFTCYTQLLNTIPVNTS